MYYTVPVPNSTHGLTPNKVAKLPSPSLETTSFQGPCSFDQANTGAVALPQR